LPLEAKKASKPPVRVGGGGIFRASGENKTFSANSAATATNAPPSSHDSSAIASSKPPTISFTSPPDLLPVSNKTSSQTSPLTMFDFNRAWDRNRNASDRWALLKSVKPAAISSLFRTSLEAPVLVSILEVFAELLDPTKAASREDNDRRILVKEYLQNFARVPRFATVLMFLTSSERNIAKKVCESVGGHIDGWQL